MVLSEPQRKVDGGEVDCVSVKSDSLLFEFCERNYRFRRNSPTISLEDDMEYGSQNEGTVLLLLSGGRDSREVLKTLVRSGYRVYGLCIDGRQGQEKIGAQRAAKEFGVEVFIKAVPYFDENTWNPLKLVLRDIAMGVVAIRLAKKLGARTIVTGVKVADLTDRRLWWLGPFLRIAGLALRLFGLKLEHPLG